MKEFSRIIRIEDPLPCGIWTAAGECGQQAYAAHAYRLDRTKGQGYSWGLLPICKQCADDAMKLYEKNRQ